MKNRRNYYRILHVQRDAPTEVIRSSYRTMMQRLKMHPDLGGDHEAATLANEAYAVLTDRDKRAEYDASLGATTRTRHDEVNTESPVADSAPEHRDSNCAFCQARVPTPTHSEPDELCLRCGSALFPVQPYRLEAETRRAIHRVSKRIPAEYWTHWPQAVGNRGEIIDLSPGGTQLRTDCRLVSGQNIRIATTVFDAVASVVDERLLDRNASYPWRIGLKFVTLRFRASRGAFVSFDA
jgi:hypothetical protein